MKIIMLVTENIALAEEIKDLISENYFLVHIGPDTADWINDSNLQSGVVLFDTEYPDALKFLHDSKVKKPGLRHIGIGKDRKQALLLSHYLYDFLLLPLEQWPLDKAVARASESISVSSGGFAVEGVTGAMEDKLSCQDFDSATRPWARVVSDFSRTISSQFNRDKFLSLFIYAVRELVPTGKLTVLLKDDDPNLYAIAAHQGLDPGINKALRLKATEGIIAWLAEEGRILNRSEVPGLLPPARQSEILQEMKILRAAICVPLIANGKLNGVLCLGSKVTGAPFYERELELLYTICGNIAIALEDIGLHEQLLHQKIYIESILQRMNSGVVAIDKSEKITTFNQKAAEVLGRQPAEMLKGDLRSLVSPLGDMLYETLLHGTAYHKKKLDLAENKMPLEVSTYRMVNQLNEVLGSVMIIDDISNRKKAEAEKSKAEQINVLNRFVSQLTHEIKNPMVAIQAYAQLLPDRYDDHEFRMVFSKTVRQEVKRLNELIDQLIAFSTPLHYQPEVIEAHDLLDQAFSLLSEQGVDHGRLIHKSYCNGSPKVKVDRLAMARALSYLIKFLRDGQTEGEKAIKILTALPENGSEPGRFQIMITDNVTKIKFDEPDQIFNPLEITPENAISIGLPVSKKVIEDHGGMLHAVQADGSALKFGIILPLFIP